MNGTIERPATDPQLNFIGILLEERALPEDALERAKARLAQGLTMSLASEWIQRLKGYPRKDGTVRPADAAASPQYVNVAYEECATDAGVKRVGFLTGLANPIPRGSYALVQDPPTKSGNDITFYKLWIGERFGWRLYVCHGPEQTEMGRTSALTVLSQIAANPGEAATRFGLNIGKCGVCGRRLTNAASRERGIGPVCAEKWGW